MPAAFWRSAAILTSAVAFAALVANSAPEFAASELTPRAQATPSTAVPAPEPSTTTTSTAPPAPTPPAPEPPAPAAVAPPRPQPQAAARGSARTKPAPVKASGAPAPRASGGAVMARALLDGMNKERSARGLPPLAWDDGLSGLASNWSAHMGATKSLVHQNMTGQLGKGALSGLIGWGENILRASTSTTATEAHTSWMRSDLHRENMLQPGFDRVGIAVFCAPDGSMWAAQEFGRSAAASLPLTSGVPPVNSITWGGNGATC